MDQRELLERYVREKDQVAFAEVVARHGDWVYSSARRQLGDEHLAEDVTQAVFVLLAEKAGSAGRCGNVGGWLFNTLRYCVKHARLQRQRRQRREREAAKMRPEILEREAGAGWEEISPVLDEAVGRLSAKDREAILARFYERQGYAEIGQTLGVSEAAAARRVERAVEKLRGVLAKKGVTAGVGALGVAMAERVTEAAPAGLMKAAAAAAGSGGAGSAGVIAKGAINMMAWAKVRVAAMFVIAAGIVGGVVVAEVTPSAPASRPSAVSPTTQKADSGTAVAAPPWEVAFTVVAVNNQEDQAKLLQQVREGIIASEGRLKNLRVDAYQTQEKWDPQAREWRYRGGGDSTAWYGGAGGAKARVEVRKELTPWVDGPAPFNETQYTVVGDGRGFEMLSYRQGVPGNVVSREPDRDVAMHPGGTGWMDSLYGLFAYRYAYSPQEGRKTWSDRFSEVLERDMKRPPGHIPVASRVRLNGVECICLSGVDGRLTLYLDPARGYAVLAKQSGPADDSVPPAPGAKRLIVDKLVEAAPGVFYPVKIRSQGYYAPPFGWQRSAWEATRVVANDPQWTDGIFAVTLREPQAGVVAATRPSK